MSDIAALDPQSDMCISVAAVVTDGNARIIDAYAADMSAALARSFRYFELLLVDNTALGEVAGRLEDLLKQLPNVRVLKLSKRYAEEIAYTAALITASATSSCSWIPTRTQPRSCPYSCTGARTGSTQSSARTTVERSRGASASGAQPPSTACCAR